MTAQSRRPKLLAIAAAVTLLAASCGSRLDAKQLKAFEVVGGQGGTGGATSAAAGTGPSATTRGTGSRSSTGVTTGGSPTTAAGRGGAGGPGTTLSTGGVGGGSGGGGGTTSSAPNLTAEGLAVSPSVCKGPAGGPGISGSEVDVGMVTTLTGPVPGLFAGAQRGINAFATYINGTGGICGRRLVVKSADDNLDASQNATATQSLAGSVLSMVGSLSGVDQGGASALQSSGVPDVGEALSTQRFNLPNNFSPVPQGIGVDLAPWVYFKQKYPYAATHMAAMSVNQSTDVAETQAAVQGLESIGYKFVYTEDNVELDQSDFSSEAASMKADGVQGLLFIAIASYYADVARALQNAGVHLALPVYNANAYDPTFIPQAGPAANGTISYSEVAMYQGEDAASNPTVALFDKWYRAVSGGALPDLYAVWGWMSGMLFIEGLNAGGGLTRPTLLSGLRRITSFAAGGLESGDDPPAKKPPGCYLIIDVINQKFVRDPADPPTGFDCTDAPDFYFGH